MSDDFLTTSALDNAVKRIQEFCSSPSLPSGGILLVCGLRGVGKTRLVDQALNERRDHAAKKRLKPLFGLDPFRRRRDIRRTPRGTQRIILPVSVDPFFPGSTCTQPGNGHDGTADATQTSPEMDGDVLTLLYNIIFALTSTIDVRSNPRHFGRTLNTRLGSLRLWLTPTALLRPQGQPHGWVALLLALASYLLATTLPHLLGLFLMRAPPPLPADDLASLLYLCFFSLAALLIAWLWLRFLDLRGLRQMGSQLYDLVHAQSVSKDQQQHLESHWQLKARRHEWGKLLGILLLAVGALTSSAQSLLEPSDSGEAKNPALPVVAKPVQNPAPPDAAKIVIALGADTSSSGKSSATGTKPPINWPSTLITVDASGHASVRSPKQNSASSSAKNGSNQTATGNGHDKQGDKKGDKQGNILLGALIALLGLFTLGASHSYSRRLHATFGAENRTWMITLLRRYLFMLHRAGLEPILVLDEIDKLGEDAQVSGETPTPGRARDICRFKSSLLRLKQSLGAEFIWILIDTETLISDLIKDRRAPRGQGPLATLIQSEVVLGPLLFNDARGYVQNRLKSQSPPSGPVPNPVPDSVIARWWLDSRGVFSKLVRIVDDQQQQQQPQQPQEIDHIAHFIALIVDRLCDDQLAEVARLNERSLPAQAALKARFDRNPWLRTWPQIGMIEFGLRLYNLSQATPRYQDFTQGLFSTSFGTIFNTAPGYATSVEASGQENIAGLIEMGAAALHLHLTELYHSGGKIGPQVHKFAPKQAGIPTQPSDWNYDTDLRIVLPRGWTAD